MAEYHTVYAEPEGTTTEWHDLQVKHGNWAPKEKPQIRAWEPKGDGGAAGKAQPVEADEGEGDVDEDDDFLEQYRKRRVEEMKAAALRPRFGSVELISGPDFVREVTNASHSVWVLVLLFKDGVPACQVLGRALSELAPRFPGTKFVKIVSTECIPNYPDQHLPTLLVYSGGQVKEKFMGLRELTLGGGGKCTPEAVALALCKVGPVLAAPGESEEEVLERVRRDVVLGLVDGHARGQN